MPEPEPEPAAEPIRRKRSIGKTVLLSVLIALAAVLLFLILTYAFREALSPAFDSITSWFDNLLNHILYNAEERQILGF